MSVVEVSLRHRLGDFALDITFTAGPGVTALFGPSGAGKSTVIAALSGLMRPDEGRIVVGDRVLLDRAAGIDLPPHRRRVGLVFQDGRLFPHLSVRQNLTYGGRFAPADAPGASFDQIVDLLGIGALLDRPPAALSGGEKQRVAIGRALLARPAVLALDEPLAALDGPRKAAILPFLERLRDQAGLPILYISHSPDEVARLANTLVLIEAGRVIAAGPVAQVMASADAARLFGARDAGSVIEATITGHDPDGVTRLDSAAGPLLLPAIAAAPGTALRLRVHAQDVILSLTAPVGLSALNILPVRVIGLDADSGGVLARLAAGPGAAPLLARVTRRSAETLGLHPGLALHAVLKAVAVASPVQDAAIT